MKKIEGLDGFGVMAMSCNFLNPFAQAPKSPQNCFNCPGES